MLPVPEAVKPSMDEARMLREDYAGQPDAEYLYAEARRTTREILRALAALRREERAGMLGGGR